MESLIQNAEYSPSELWKNFFPGKSIPEDESWCSDYLSVKHELIFFVDLTEETDAKGKQDNSFDPITGVVQWFSRPNLHSEQPQLKRLREGKVRPFIFLRFLKGASRFTYLGRCLSIVEIIDNAELLDGNTGLSIKFGFGKNASGMSSKYVDVGPEGFPISAVEGHKVLVAVNRFERSPKLRAICLDAKGCTCLICGFDFEQVYGELGRQYCHVHHITPLSELDGASEIDPIDDLIPVCANCHAMLHRKSPALLPNQLVEIINK